MENRELIDKVESVCVVLAIDKEVAKKVVETHCMRL